MVEDEEVDQGQNHPTFVVGLAHAKHAARYKSCICMMYVGYIWIVCCIIQINQCDQIESAVGTQTGKAMTSTCEEQEGRVAAPALASVNSPA